MFRRTSLFRRVTAASCLVVFLNVFVGQALCALVRSPAAAHEHEHQHQHPVGTVPHHHDSERPAPVRPHHEPDHKHSGSSSPQPGTKGACCQDDAAAVWASLTHPPKVGVEKPLPGAFLLPAGTFFFTSRFQRWDRSRPVLLVARRQLKPKIPDIRIFIRSLTV